MTKAIRPPRFSSDAVATRKGAQDDVRAENGAPRDAASFNARSRVGPANVWYRINGGFPAAHSKRSLVVAAHVKNSPSWIRAHGARWRAWACADESRSTPKLFRQAARKRPSPHDGSSIRSVGTRVAHRTSVCTMSLGV